MRIELDTKTKTILLLENINIEELLVELENLEIDFTEWSFITERPHYFRTNTNTNTYIGTGIIGGVPYNNCYTTNKNVPSTLTK